MKPRPPNRLMPPLSMLRAFEAAARHGSMTRAAVELNVTHGAVSRQIAMLEQFLDLQLFRRKSKGIQLTEDGDRLFHGVFSGFERIRVTIEDLWNQRAQEPVSITTLPTFAGRWLLPRLSRFHAEHPAMLVNVRAGTALEDLADPGLDFAIRYGTGSWPNVISELLLPVSAYPACSPSFIERFGRPERPEDLLRCPLIHDVTRQWWIDWFIAAGVTIDPIAGGIIVDEYGLAVQSAVDGHGIVLARDPLLNREMASGDLVRLFDIDVTPRFSYYIAYDSARSPRREARLLIEWLKEQAIPGASRP